MPRFHDWRARLKSYLATAAKRPFEQGRHDCAIFALGAVAAMTGTDILEGIRGRYTTTRGGLRILRRMGHADHIALAAAHFRPRAADELAGLGDLAAFPSDEGPALGIVQGLHIYAAGVGGLHLVPISLATQIFEV